ncbi:N-acetyl-gamma-glutamyl-phosphate reductase [Pontixanthobacter aestiaquae]|uniref:N-acetyl-gamma-glutamyl-phosphate reductase n=1 Tax=Pontixanthobacter aestiaquae TaxID=1509367 RepID=A0A844Z4W6_9SPHN|nr:N-acetyl-gamma-glutamyl-phosphate reductase [Pontixanthobacter aestiaquae]MDN3646043.1 N-acetyl-gamma-glutamyl-phosphate reductase [Pontixanthobacter aestiaquae]MXO82965.1 N-acetyl-gamma-glutamyl-phosphate reductase [Pontixanthobacter aestiaquae]
MTTSVFIDGAAGTTGLEIRERLSGRSEFSLVALPDDLRKDTEVRREALNDCDVAILCLPDAAARESVSLIDNDRTKVIDASTAHRLADGWTYGFPELIGAEEVANAKRVSNPGCYPTGFLALVAPLVRSKNLPADWPYSVNAVSGFSGGGNALIDRFADDRTIAWRGYGLSMGHKHLGEMQRYSGLKHAPLFSPAVVDAHRGMFVEVPIPLAAMGSGTGPVRMHKALSEFYDGSPIVTVGPLAADQSELLLRKDAAPWDGMKLHVFFDGMGEQVRLIAKLDNLGKGASGAAVQSLNLMAGLDAETGLSLTA